MATVSLNLDISASGLKGLVELSSQFNKNMQAGAAASKTTAGGTAGSRALSAPASSAPSYMAAKAENQGYNTQRAVGPGTGSATSDFARQASGLGGLVHVYATFAANMFAVSAGFTVLSKAMDTSNLVKGLDQIGAASGRNLGSLAKQMVAATNGAISLQQAMTSTAMASSGGMTNDAIIRMTEVAKKASLALGRDMTDSMDRLTKGIVKTQPELLDELGIMTRVIPAQQAYAQQIGKTVGALTDFEKRQAFANAVLTEGEKKFGSINLDTNPYSKILSSMQNLAQTGLELVNKVLGPLLNVLSQSPTALMTIMAGIGAVLLKQAIPALGMFREQAKQAQEEAHYRMQTMVKLQQDAAAESDSIAATAAEKAYQREKKTQDTVVDLQKARFNKKLVGTDNRVSLTKSPFDLSDKEMSDLRAKADTLLAHEDETYKRQGEKLTTHLDSVDKLKLESSRRGDEAAAKSEANDAKWYSHQEQLAAKAKKLAQSAAKSDVLSGVADTAATFGPVAAFKSLREETSKLDMGRVAKGITLVQGSLSIATSAVSTAVGAFGVWAQVIGLVVAGFQILDGFMTSSAKEVEAYGVSLTTLTSSVDNVTRTLEVINNKDLNDFLSVESSQAKATALNDLSLSISGMLNKFDKLKSAQDSWDKFFDGLWSVVGKGSSDKLANGLSSSVISAFKAMEEGPVKEKAKAAIQDIVGQNIDLTSFSSLKDAINSLPVDEMLTKGKQVDEALKTSAREAGNAAAALTGFKAALADVSKQSVTMSNSLIPKDDFSKLGIEVAKAASAMGDALKGGPVDGLLSLKELSGDLRTLSLLPPGTAKDLANSKKELENITVMLADARKEQADAEAKIATAKQVIKDKGGSTIKGEQAQEVIDTETVRSNLAKARELASLKNAEDINKKFAAIPQMFAQISYDNLAKGLNKALSEAAISAAKGYLDLIKSAGGSTAEADATLNIKSIDIQIEDIKAKYTNSEKLQALTLAVEQNTAIQDRAALLASRDIIARQGGSTTEIDTKVAELNKTIVTLSTAMNTAKGGSKAIITASKQSAAGDTGATGVVKALGSLATEAFGKESALAKLFSDKGTAELQKKLGIFTDIKTTQIASLDSQDKITNRLLGENATAISINGAYSSTLQQKKEELEQGLLLSKAKKDELDLVVKIAAAQLVVNTSKDTKAKDQATTLSNKLVNDLLEARQKLESDISIKGIKDLQARLASETANAKVISDNLDLVRRDNSDIFNAKLVAQESEISYLKEIGALSEEDYINKKKSIDLSQQENSFINTRVDLVRKYLDESKAIQDAKATKVVAYSDMGPVDTSVEDTKQTNLEASFTRQLETQNLINEAKKQSIALTADYSGLLAAQAEQMSSLVSATESLSKAFGTVGETLGKAVETIQIFNDKSVKGTIAVAAAEKKVTAAKEKTALAAAMGLDTKDFIKEQAIEERNLAKIQSKNTADQLDGISSIAGQSKKAFEEKSDGYRALSAVEQASASISSAIRAVEMAKTLADLPTNIAGGISKMFAQTGWGGVAGAAVLLAMMSGLGVSAGSSVPTTPPPEQGTGGVVGDSKALNTGLEDSLKTLVSIAKPELPMTSAMVKYLKSIDNSMTDFLVSISSGSLDKLGTAGNVISSSSGSNIANFLGTTGANFSSSLQNALGLGGLAPFDPLAGLTDSIAAAIGGSSRAESRITGTGLSIGAQTAGQRAASSDVKGFVDSGTETNSTGWFGTNPTTTWTQNARQFQKLDASTSQAITDTYSNMIEAISLGGKMLKIDASSISNVVLKEINVAQKASETQEQFAKRVFASISQDATTIVESIMPTIHDFMQTGETSTSAFARLATSMEEAQLYTDKLNISTVNYAEIVNKHGDISAEAVRQAIVAAETTSSVKTVTNSLNLFGTWIKWSSDVVVTATSNIGTIIDNFTGTASDLASLYTSLVDVRTSLVALGISSNTVNTSLLRGAGGIDALNTGLSDFTSSFLTTTEQTTLKQAKMDAEFTKLGKTTPKTAQEFKDLVLSLKDGGESTSEMLGRVLLLSAGMKDLVGTIEGTSSAVSLASSMLDQTITILGLLGNAEGALALTRQKELDALDPALKANQKYIYALQDEATLKAKLVTSYNTQTTAINSTITSLKSSVKTLKDYRNTLDMGTNSVLDPTQKYQASKQTLSGLEALISGPALSDAEKAAQADAVSKFPAASDAFLAASKVLFSSSAQYTQDFQTVADFVDTSSAALASQQSDTEKQLSVLKDTYTTLGIISDTLDNTNQLLADYLAAKSATAAAAADPGVSLTAIPAHANGGMAYGISLVGEKGPELVDFSTPARVYSNKASNGMFNTDAMVNELRALRKEVAQLRQEQQEQTGHIITTNYDANRQAADKVAGATEDAANVSAWNSRVAPTLL